MRSNLERAHSALAALRAWRGDANGHDKPDEGDLTDLLCDLMHLARLSMTRRPQLREELAEYRGDRWSFEVELGRAQGNHDAEKEAPTWSTAFNGL